MLFHWATAITEQTQHQHISLVTCTKMPYSDRNTYSTNP